jgi:hypothetical protein
MLLAVTIESDRESGVVAQMRHDRRFDSIVCALRAFERLPTGFASLASYPPFPGLSLSRAATRDGDSVEALRGKKVVSNLVFACI